MKCVTAYLKAFCSVFAFRNPILEDESLRQAVEQATLANQRGKRAAEELDSGSKRAIEQLISHRKIR